MTAPKFVQIHTLHSYPASLLNRDDAGLAKRIPFGEVERLRISSQCLKRHWRVADDGFALARIDPSLGPSIRSRLVWQECVALPLIGGKGLDRELVIAVLKKMQELFYASDEAKRKPKGDTTGLGRNEVVVLGRPEVEFFKALVEDIVQSSGNDVKVAAGEVEKRFKDKSFRANLHNLKAGAGIDAAMFGRFVSGDREARVDAAVHVAHALTVHEQASETDYFTAVDDLQAEEQGAGAGHVNAAELTSGVYYGYVVVDVPQLVSNLEGCDRKQWLEADRTLAARAVEHLLHLVAKVTPGAKLGSTAPYGWASLALVEAGEEQPRTLANAFIEPVRGGPLDARAAAALARHVGEIDAMYGASGRRWLASRHQDVAVAGAEAVAFPGLVAAVGDALRGGGRA
jgi:CRISPR system Cascade subunit CasC